MSMIRDDNDVCPYMGCGAYYDQKGPVAHCANGHPRPPTKPKYGVGDEVRVSPTKGNIYHKGESNKEGRILVVGWDNIRERLRNSTGKIEKVEYSPPEEKLDDKISGWSYMVTFVETKKDGEAIREEKSVSFPEEFLGPMGEPGEEDRNELLALMLKHHPVVHKDCGGIYWPRGDGVWWSRMTCDKCGDYYDMGGGHDIHMGVSAIMCANEGCGNVIMVPEHLVHRYLANASCTNPNCGEPLVGSRVEHVVDNAPLFKSMQDAIDWAVMTQRPIQEFYCPKFDMAHPIEDDLEECGVICSNPWGCHTYRHINGSRVPCPKCGMGMENREGDSGPERYKECPACGTQVLEVGEPCPHCRTTSPNTHMYGFTGKEELWYCRNCYKPFKIAKGGEVGKKTVKKDLEAGEVCPDCDWSTLYEVENYVGRKSKVCIHCGYLEREVGCSGIEHYHPVKKLGTDIDEGRDTTYLDQEGAERLVERLRDMGYSAEAGTEPNCTGWNVMVHKQRVETGKGEVDEQTE